MDVARLILDYIRVLSWPLVAVAGLWLFRGDLADFIRRLRLLKGPAGLVAELAETGLGRAQQSIGAAVPHVDDPEIQARLAEAERQVSVARGILTQFPKRLDQVREESRYLREVIEGMRAAEVTARAAAQDPRA